MWVLGRLVLDCANHFARTRKEDKQDSNGKKGNRMIPICIGMTRGVAVLDCYCSIIGNSADIVRLFA